MLRRPESAYRRGRVTRARGELPVAIDARAADSVSPAVSIAWHHDQAHHREAERERRARRGRRITRRCRRPMSSSAAPRGAAAYER